MTRQRGWNGLQFTLPEGCEDIVSGARHLLIEKDFLPVMEIRWELPEGKKSTASVKSVVRQLKKSSPDNFRETTPPQYIAEFARKKAVYSLQTDGAGDEISLIWQCTTCRTLILCRVYSQRAVSRNDIATTLQSISCHQQNDTPALWSVQDFRLHIPTGYHLDSYSFQAGLTRLLFKDKIARILFCRMAPASDRLADMSLERLLCSLHDRLSIDNIEVCTENTANVSTSPSLMAQILLRLKRQKAFCRGMIRHDQASNRILALITESNRPIEQEFIQAIFSQYEIIS